MGWRRATTAREISKNAKIEERENLERFLEETEANLPSEAEALIYDGEETYGPFEQELPDEEELNYEFEGTVTVLNTSTVEFTSAASGREPVEAYADGKVQIRGEEYEKEFRLEEFYQSPATNIFHWDYSKQDEQTESYTTADTGKAEAGSD